MSTKNKIHWFAPTLMLAAFFTAVVLTVGHHLFYHNLEGKLVPADPYHVIGHRLSHQQFNTSVGVALTRLVSTLLGLALSTAYAQLFWSKMKRVKLRPTLGELDWANGGLRSVFSLLNWKAGHRYPLLLTLAFLFWCLPICTIFPPATLSVVATPTIIQSMSQVPHFDFASFKYASSMFDIYPIGNNAPTLNASDIFNLLNESASDALQDIQPVKGADAWSWTGPSGRVARVAAAVTSVGEILPIVAPAPNSSWSLDFRGPRMRCEDLVNDDRESILTNIWNSYDWSASPENGGQGFSFLSWVPWDMRSLDKVNASHDSVGVVTPFITVNGNITGPPASDLALGDGSIFIAVMTGMASMMNTNSSFMFMNGTGVDQGQVFEWDGTGIASAQYNDCPYRTITSTSESFNCTSMDGQSTIFTPAQAFNDTTLFRCNLINGSYTAHFSYPSGAQSITIDDLSPEPAENVTPSDAFAGPLYSSGTPISRDCDALRSLADYGNMPCIYDAGALSLLSYQSISSAFNHYLVGSITGYSPTTLIMKTILADTDELAYNRPIINAPAADAPTGGSSLVVPPLQTWLSGSDVTDLADLTQNASMTSRGSLKSNIEQLFLNFTMSLLSDPYLQPNYDSPYAPPQMANVSFFESFRTTYVYDALTLWLAYGIAISFATIAVIAGALVLFTEGISHSDNFSTIVRVARAAEISVDVKEYDGLGHDPLPKYLRNARMEMSSGKVEEEKGGEEESLTGGHEGERECVEVGL